MDGRSSPFFALLAAAFVAGHSHPAGAASAVEGLYDDPNHPGCRRTIDSAGVIRGVDPVPFERGAGCSAPGISANAWKIQGKVSKDQRSVLRLSYGWTS